MKLNSQAKGNDKLRHLFEIFQPNGFSANAKKILTKVYTPDKKETEPIHVRGYLL